MQQFDLDRAALERQASLINLWWTAGRDPHMPFEEAVAIRHRDIDSLFGRIERERRDAYSRASCLVVHTKKCASTAGRRHTCPMSITPPADMRFRSGSIEAIDDDFDGWPTLHTNGVVTYTVKKTGRGSNTAGFRAIAEYTPEYVEQRITAEMDQVHQLLDPIFRVELQSSGTQ